jgi:UDPglucose 6-dehydrogenase
MPIFEPGLEELVNESARRRRLRFSTDLSEVVRGIDVLFIAVDTPQGDDGSAGFTSVAAVARRVGKTLAEFGAERARPLVVVKKCTVPVSLSILRRLFKCGPTYGL